MQCLNIMLLRTRTPQRGPLDASVVPQTNNFAYFVSTLRLTLATLLKTDNTTVASIST